MTALNVPSFKSFAPQSGKGAIFHSSDYAKRDVSLPRVSEILHNQVP